MGFKSAQNMGNTLTKPQIQCQTLVKASGILLISVNYYHKKIPIATKWTLGNCFLYFSE